jgi:hypothetical protein
MFQNLLRLQSLKESDPFAEMDSQTEAVSSGVDILDFSTELFNPFTQFLEGNSLEADSINTINPEQHFVNPHQVSGYERSDGTYVESYWRDGDGDTSVDLQVEDGGGYSQTNPDGNIFNNLG